MRPLRAWLVRLAAVFGGSRRDREFGEELESHLQMHIDDNLCAGMAPEEARRRALVALGGVELTRERYRDRRGIPALESVAQDLRYAARVFRKNPGFAAVAVVVLALGIGVNTAVFTLVNTLLLRPLGGSRSSDLVSLYSQSTQYPDRYRSFSYPDYRDIRDDHSVFSDIAAHTVTFVGITEDARTRRVLAEMVSANYFGVFGVPMLKGRTFAADEEVPGRDRPAVISATFTGGELVSIPISLARRFG